MGENRKPEIVMLLRKQGNATQKVELFDTSLFSDSPVKHGACRGRYRIRVNGSWVPKGERAYYTMYEFRDMLWRSLFGDK